MAMTKKERARNIGIRLANRTKSLQRTGGEYLGAVFARRLGIQERSIGPVPMGIGLGLLGAYFEYKRGATARLPMQLAIGAAKVQGPIALYERESTGQSILGALNLG